MRLRLLTAGVVLTAGLAASLTLAQTSCNQTPTNVAVHTMEAPKRMDILCVQALDPLTATPIPAIPVTLDHCAPVSSSDTTFGTDMVYHTLAVVTQTLRGELAVVDLTLQRVIDTSLALPGINFLPVGRNPTDVVVTPDAQTVFVAAAETNRPAIYAIPSTKLLGDSQNLDEPTQAAEQVSLPSWPACALPQAPGRMVIVPKGQGYEIVIVMPGNGTDEPALAGIIDTTPFTDGTIAPGSLAACPIKSVIHLAENQAALPTTWTPGPTWPVGLPYADADVDLFATTGAQPPALPVWSCPSLLHAPGADAGTPDAAPLRLAPAGQAHAAGVATDGRFVWVADQAMPFIHVLDTQGAGALTEIAPLAATSMVEPSRVVTTSELAVSPVTRDYKRFLYAVDERGNLMVYDVTDPVNGPRTPMTRPHPELNPLQAPDRILLSAPVATVAFARHDFPYAPSTSGPSLTGLLCNPNPNAGTPAAPVDYGVEYGSNGSIAVALGPMRLRGVFAFATMTNGQVVAIDVDDWDAPCRRPLTLTANARTGSLSLPEPVPSSNADFDPYHSPNAEVGMTATVDGGLNQSVTGEVFWPVIQPHRVRSQQLEEDDLVGTGGLHAPELSNAPILYRNSAPISIAGQPFAVITAALPEFEDLACVSKMTCAAPPTPAATQPNVFMAWDVPDVHVDQTWNIVYEGILPAFTNVLATISSTDFTTMTFTDTSAFFCGHGIEDQAMGLNRYAAMKAEDALLTKPADTQSYIPISFDKRVGDYVQITDDIAGAADAGPNVPLDDKYWSEDAPGGTACWKGVTFGGQDLSVDDPKMSGDQSVALARQQMCIDKFGPFGALQNPQRDFPILEAYEDHLVLGRYVYLDPANRPTNGRQVAQRDTTAQVDFQLAQCCFHNQAHFNVRTGAEWVALGANGLYLHHVVADSSGRCVQSCDPHFVLLNSRAPELAVGSIASTVLGQGQAPTRNSAFAMRNPALSFFLPAPAVTGTLASTTYSISIRDDDWQFPTRGQYFAEGISLTASNTTVLPQSSMFIPPLGAFAVIDGASQGLYIIDLNTLTISDGSPFY